jgi:hypothetical protein
MYAHMRTRWPTRSSVLEICDGSDRARTANESTWLKRGGGVAELPSIPSGLKFAWQEPSGLQSSY